MNNRISDFDPCEALTVKEVAALLHVSRPTVEKYIKRGELPSTTIGRCRRIRRIDLESFLDCRTACGWQRYQPEPPGPIDGSRTGFFDKFDSEGKEIPF